MRRVMFGGPGAARSCGGAVRCGVFHHACPQNNEAQLCMPWLHGRLARASDHWFSLAALRYYYDHAYAVISLSHRIGAYD